MSNTTKRSLKHIEETKELAMKLHIENKIKAREFYKGIKQTSKYLLETTCFDENFFFNRDDRVCSFWIEEEFNNDLFVETKKPKTKRSKKQ